MISMRPALMAVLALTLLSTGSPAVRADDNQARPEVDLTHPLTADECVRLALDRNYRIAQAADQKGIVDANKLRAWGGFVPSFSAGYDYNHSQVSPHTVPPSIFDYPSKTDGTGWALNASQNLFNLQIIYGIMAAQRASGAADEAVTNAEQTAAQIVRTQYYNLIEAIKLKEVADEDLKLADEELKRTQSLFDVGSVARTDVLKSNVRVSEATASVTSTGNRVRIERAGLNQALALPPDTPTQVVESLDPRGDTPDSLAAYAEATANRPDLKAARLRESAASADHKAAWAGKAPFIGHSWRRTYDDSRGSYLTGFDQNGDRITESAKRQTYQWGYQIGVSWHILDGLVTESAIQQTKYNHLLTEHEALDLENSVLVETQAALVSIQNAEAQVRTAREARVSADEDLKLSQERYSVGLGTILELIDAQVAFSRARSGEVTAMAELKRSEALLDKALGRSNW